MLLVVTTDRSFTDSTIRRLGPFGIFGVNTLKTRYTIIKARSSLNHGSSKGIALS
jgi:hypothetical protein